MKPSSNYEDPFQQWPFGNKHRLLITQDQKFKNRMRLITAQLQYIQGVTTMRTEMPQQRRQHVNSSKEMIADINNAR